MKRTLVLFLLAILLVAACGSNDDPVSTDAPAGDVVSAPAKAGDALVTVFRAPT